MDFRQSLEHLARKAGVDLTLFSNSDGRTAKRRARSREALKLAANFYQQNLVKNSTALNYVVKKRRLNRQTIGDFLIGYAPENGDTLTKALEKTRILQAGIGGRWLVESVWWRFYSAGE